MRKYLLILIMMICYLPAAAEITGQTDDPMIIAGGARPMGMGRAFTAVANDIDAPFINPAGIAGMKGPQAMVMTTNLLMGEIYFRQFSGALPATFGTLGLGYISTGVNGIPVTVDTTPSFTDYYDTLMLVTYSTPMSRFFDFGRQIFIGANYKIFDRGWTGMVNEYATGTNLDVGLKVIATPNFSFGLCRQNILPVTLGGTIRWSSGAEEAITGLTRLGVAVRPVQFERNVLFSGDVVLPSYSGRPITSHLGAEWDFHPNLALRAGLDQSVDSASPTLTNWDPTFGASLRYLGFNLDYAYHAFYNDPALANHYVSIAYAAEPWWALQGRAAPAEKTLRRRW